MKQLEEIKARASAATAGPWDADGFSDFMDGVDYTNLAIFPEDNRNHMIAADLKSQDDTTFIVNARTDVPKLVAALEAVEDVLQLLDSIEATYPTIAPGALNVSAAGAAAVIRGAIDSALEAE